MVIPSLIQIVWAGLWLLIFGVCGYALWKGGPPERFGAALILLVALLGGLIEIGLKDNARQVGHLAADGLLAMGFLFVAVRYTSLWLGGAMLFQAVQFSLHAFYFVLKRPYDPLYSIVNNIDLFGVLSCLLAGALAANGRARARPAEAA
ncbi:MAG: hypothetical protein ACK4YQ_02325 [Phenylobacterium sp.]|uniref:hypothetical protein n=1 Tax=Phenylobacterium sp. TaxID=1871053 RepID=UPI00391C9A79